MKKRTLLIILMIIGIIPMSVNAQPLNFEWSCDVIDSNPNSFLLDENIYNGTHWIPLWYHLYWNGTALISPPLEYQIGSFDFSIVTSHNASKVVAIHGNNYTGPPNDYDWISTNGVIIATDGPFSHTEPLNGTLNVSLWQDSGWCKFHVFGSYYDPHYDTAIAFGEIYFFYMSSSLDVESPLPLPSQGLGVIQMVVEVFAIPFRILRNTIMGALNTLLP